MKSFSPALWVIYQMLLLPAVVCSLWFNAAAFWTLVDDLSWLQLQTLHVFFSGVTFGNSSLINTMYFTSITSITKSSLPHLIKTTVPSYRICQHGSQVRRQRQHSQEVKCHAVNERVPEAFGGEQHDKVHHKFCVHNQKPGHEGAHHPAAVLDEPDAAGSHLLLPSAEQGLVLLHIPQPVAWRLHSLLRRQRERSEQDERDSHWTSIPATHNTDSYAYL